MKILILNGSPRKNGSTARVLKLIETSLSTKHTVETIDVVSLKFSSCQGCFGCRPDKECVMAEDDAHRIGRKIAEADGVIVGSPTYWGNMSGPLKSLMDRLVTTFEVSAAGSFSKPRLKGKKAAIVTASGAPWPFNHLSSQGKGTIRSIKTVLRNGGYQISGIINYGGAAQANEIPPSIIKKAKKIGEQF